MTALSTSLAMITLLNSISIEQRINIAIQKCMRKQYWKNEFKVGAEAQSDGERPRSYYNALLNL
jgi:hypothetical protein|tara:strand:- start:74 stop:265 length:192 start_codon:yes stop_codon:yes gene_type:complete